MTDPRIDAALLAVEHVQRRLHTLADGPGYTAVPWQTKRSARRLSKMLASILPGLLELSDQAEEITAYAEAQPSEDAQPAEAHAPKSPRDLLAAILANPTHVPPFIADLVQQAIDALDDETLDRTDAPHEEVIEADERVQAWHRVARHPYLQPAFDQDRPLLDAILDMLDQRHERDEERERMAVLRERERIAAWLERKAENVFEGEADSPLRFAAELLRAGDLS